MFCSEKSSSNKHLQSTYYVPGYGDHDSQGSYS